MPQSDVPRLPHGRHDPGLRRQAKRTGRERGAWVYLSAQHLLDAGVGPGDPPPFYRVWPSRRGSAVIRLYREA